MRVLVAGSHGLIGTALVKALHDAGHEVLRLVRSGASSDGPRWDPAAGELDLSRLGTIDAAVNLGGEGLADKRWTADQKRRILDSRVDSTTLLARRLADAGHRPAVLVSGSAIGFYGDRGDEVLDEDSAGGSGFLADVCQQWEAATAAASDAGIRVVHARTGLVLTPVGGALKKQLPLFKLGMGGKLGSGQQYQSWITLDDEVGAVVHALHTESLAGPVNLTAPNPVTNAAFTKALGSVLGRPTLVAAPKFGLSSVLGGQLVSEMVLASQRVVPRRLLDSGYRFRHPDLIPALRALLA